MGWFEVQGRHATQLLHRVSRVVPRASIHLHKPQRLRVEDVDFIQRVFEDATECLLHLLGRFVLRNIANDARKQPRPGARDLAHGEIHGKNVTVFAEALQLTSDANDPPFTSP